MSNSTTDSPKKDIERDIEERIMDLVATIRERLKRLPGHQLAGAIDDETLFRRIEYHLPLLEEGGLIIRNDPAAVNERFPWLPEYRLTWKGHEVLETVREGRLWEKAKRAVLEKSGGLALDVAYEVAKRKIVSV